MRAAERAQRQEKLREEKPQEGSVLAVGAGRLLESGQRVVTGVKDGDAVLFTKHGGTEVKLDGEDYLVIRESDLLAIVTTDGL